VAFHVEIRRGRRWAREFNLSEEDLRRSVLDPWVRGRPVSLGDREWDPGDCDLRVIEGPELSPEDLAFGRGWGAAERSGRDVARELVGGASRKAATVAVLAETDSTRSSIAGALDDLGLASVAWSRPTGDEQPRPVAVVLAPESSVPGRQWLFDAGSAIGALGGRAVVASPPDGPPPELAALESVEPGDEFGSGLAAALARLGI
jgi:hypothetical protein